MELHGFLNIDKPLGRTSHDVVARVRRALRTRRVGHAGTLDPAATGVLVVGVGRATRFLDYVQHESKSYLAHVVLGKETDSADIDGRLLDGRPERHVSVELTDITALLPEFVGQIDQVPPKFSAIKQGGEPLHRKVRRGESVEVPVRQVRVDAIDIQWYSFPDLILSITGGPGVYIRSLARDIGERLGCGAYLHHLVRTRVGGFSLDQAHSLHDIDNATFPESWTLLSTAIDHGVAHVPAISLSQRKQTAWYHGRSIRAVSATVSPNSFVRAFTPDSQFAGIGVVADSGETERTVRPRIVLAQT